MLSFHVKFVQTDGRTDRRTMVKQYAPDLTIWGHKKTYILKVYILGGYLLSTLISNKINR